ncbi:MAG: PAS domain S-box protein [bacterium]
MKEENRTEKKLEDELKKLRQEITRLKALEGQQKQMENALKESEEMYKTLVKTSPDAVTITNLDGNITEVSQRTLELHGFSSPEEILGKNSFDLIAQEDHEKARKNVLKTLQNGYIRNQKYTLLKKDGTHFYGEINAALVSDISSKPKAFIGITRDITEQEKTKDALQQAYEALEIKVEERTCDLKSTNKKLQEEIDARRRAEEALRESEERFRMIVELSPFPISIFDSDGIYLYINRKFTEVFGYTLKDVPTGKKWFDLAFPDPKYRQEAISAWKSDLEKLAKKKIMPRLFNVRCKNGSVRKIIFRPLKMNYDQLFIIYEDITDRKRAQEEVYKAKEYLEKVFNSVTDSIIVSGLNTRVVTFNKATEKIFGYKSEEIVGKSIRKIFPDKSAFKDLVRNSLKEIQEHGHFEGEITLRHKSGRTFPVSLISSMLMGTDGKPIGIVSVGRDITERKQTEEAKEKLESHLRQAQKMEAIGTLAGGIAHDFNNILSVVLGYVELSIDAFPEGSSARSNMEEVIRVCNRGKDLVKQILTFSRKVEKDLVPVQINSIVDEALRFIRASIPSTIEIRQDIDTKSGSVLANPTQIQQIIINLCSNAYYAMRESGGILEIKLGAVQIGPDSRVECQDLKDGTYIRLTIKDTGHGIEKSDLERIFDPFFTTKPPGEGTGMGLSTVHGIVRAHGGSITVSSEIGKGTTFNIYLPRLSKDAPTKEAKPELTSEGREHILLVDDEESIIYAGKIVLERLGYKVTALKSSSEALEIFHKNPGDFDLVITDQTMPAMTGAELASKLMLIRPTIPVILTTGYSELITREKAKKLGIRDYIMKPFLARDLAKAIRKIMDQEYTV